VTEDELLDHSVSERDDEAKQDDNYGDPKPLLSKALNLAKLHHNVVRLIHDAITPNNTYTAYHILRKIEPQYLITVSYTHLTLPTSDLV